MSLYDLDLDHEHFRWAAGLPEWLVLVRTREEYRLVATKPGGGLKRWCKAKRQAAVDALARLEKDIEERPLCGYTDPYLEVRQVTEWRRL